MSEVGTLVTLPCVSCIWILGDVNGGFKVSLGPLICACLFLLSKVAQLLIYIGFSPDHLFGRFVLQSLVYLQQLWWVLICVCMQPWYLCLLWHLSGTACLCSVQVSPQYLSFPICFNTWKNDNIVRRGVGGKNEILQNIMWWNRDKDFIGGIFTSCIS